MIGLLSTSVWKADFKQSAQPLFHWKKAKNMRSITSVSQTAVKYTLNMCHIETN